MYVAFGRAVASYERQLSRVCHDERAEALLPRSLARLIACGKQGERGQRLLGALRSTSFGMFEHLALRTRVIDDALLEGLAAGARQLVLLGAGLDARAHRLPQLAET